LESILRKYAPKRSSELALTSETLLVDDFGVDSPRMVDILLDIEDRFRVTIDDSEAQKANTFGDLVALVSRISSRPN